MLKCISVFISSDTEGCLIEIISYLSLSVIKQTLLSVRYTLVLNQFNAYAHM